MVQMEVNASQYVLRRARSARGTCAAAARGPRRQGGGARSRRRTDLAMRPLGAAVVRAGVGLQWPFALLGGPAPRAAASSESVATQRKAGTEGPVAERSEGARYLARWDGRTMGFHGMRKATCSTSLLVHRRFGPADGMYAATA